MVHVASQRPKRPVLADGSAGLSVVADVPHNDLRVPLAAVGREEIRTRLIKRPVALITARETVDHPARQETANSSKWETSYTRFLKNYRGDGTELADKQESGTSLDYEAISYVWGEPIYSHQLELERHGLSRITESLYRALQRLRSPDNRRRLWADAICINQADITERSAQVAIMASVYQQANGVLVWLGPSQDLDALAFAAIPKYLDARGGDFEGLWETLEASLLNNSCCPCCSESFDLVQNITAEALLAIGRVLLRPWFSRLWVVQETHTSARLRDHAAVFCGSHHISYVDLRDAAQSIRSDSSPRGTLQLDSKFPRDLLEKITTMWSGANPLDNWFADIGEWPPSYLLRILAGMSVRNCFNPLDRVYAVRSLMDLGHQASLVPDYTHTPAEVYRRLVIVLFEEFQRRGESDLDQAWALLTLAGTTNSDTTDPNRPSWVHDFSALTLTSRGKLELYTRFAWLQVPQFLPAPHLFSTRFTGPREDLQVRARCFAVVQELFPNIEYPTLNETEVDRLSAADSSNFRAWHRYCLQCIEMAGNADEEVISHPTTFLACGIQLAHLPANEIEYVEGAIDHSGGWLFPETWPEDPNIVREHFMLLCATRHNPPDKSRRIARITVEGEPAVKDYCWVPPRAKQGDWICVVAGATFPFVVRHLSDGSLEVIGDAYLANTTLKQALGGGDNSRFDEDIHEEVDHPVADDWNAEDEVMQKRIVNMDWVTLHQTFTTGFARHNHRN
ncbi:hypothetical protein LTR85_006191 [Meristemomyces frigidus]|nr:hypothetical protein LTR85_006191 [Meristemomyces frigidus]